MTSSDLELLELAAKAAGLGGVWYIEGFDTPYVGDKPQPGLSINYRTFNPLTDDGDALRLAVQLSIEVVPLPPHGVMALCRAVPSARAKESSDSSDPYAATRRAIVRAAAEIGRRQ